MSEVADFITVGAQLRTRAGWPARVLVTDRKDALAPVIALVTDGDGAEMCLSYLPSGQHIWGKDHGHDLVPHPPKPRELHIVHRAEHENGSHADWWTYESEARDAVGDKGGVFRYIEWPEGWTPPRPPSQVLPEPPQAQADGFRYCRIPDCPDAVVWRAKVGMERPVWCFDRVSHTWQEDTDPSWTWSRLIGDGGCTETTADGTPLEGRAG